MENLPVLVRLGIGLIVFGVVVGSVGYLSYRSRDESVDPSAESESRLDRALAERRQTADATRYFLYLVPIGFVLLVAGALVEVIV